MCMKQQKIKHRISVSQASLPPGQCSAGPGRIARVGAAQECTHGKAPSECFPTGNSGKEGTCLVFWIPTDSPIKSVP